MGVDTEWGTKAVSTVSQGLAPAGDWIFRPRPAILNEQLTQLVGARGWRNQLALIAVISWASLLRVHSECPSLT